MTITRKKTRDYDNKIKVVIQPFKKSLRNSIHCIKSITGNHDKIILWSYPQIMYGEFNKQLHNDAKSNSDEAYKHQQKCIAEYESLAVHLGVEPDKTIMKSKNRDTVAELLGVMNSKNITKKRRNDEQVGTMQLQKSKKAKPNTTKKTKEWFFDDIEVNDVVAFRTSEINADYIGVPGKSSGFILIYIETVDALNCRVSGKCFRGSIYELVMKDIKTTRTAITDNDVLWIWSLDDHEDPKQFSIPTEDIKVFCSNCVH